MSKIKESTITVLTQFQKDLQTISVEELLNRHNTALAVEANHFINDVDDEIYNADIYEDEMYRRGL